MRRARALLFFTVGYAVLALLEPVVAAGPAAVAFYLGGLEILRAADEAEPRPVPVRRR